MLLAEFDEEAFVRDIREEGRTEERAEALKDLIITLQKFVSSPQELYQTVISNERYKDLTFEEVQKIAEL